MAVVNLFSLLFGQRTHIEQQTLTEITLSLRKLGWKLKKEPAIENDSILISADNIFKEIQKIDPRLRWQDWPKD